LVGTKSEQAFKLYVGELEKIRTDPNGGLQVLRAQFEKAAHEKIHGAKWRSITHERWKQYDPSSRLARGGTNGYRSGNDRPGPELRPLSEVYPADDPYRIFQ